MQQESLSMAHLFSCSLFFISAPCPQSQPGYATETELPKEATPQVIGRMKEKGSLKQSQILWQLLAAEETRLIRKVEDLHWQASILQLLLESNPVCGLSEKKKFCGYTVLYEIKETFLHGHRLC